MLASQSVLSWPPIRHPHPHLFHRTSSSKLSEASPSAKATSLGNIGNITGPVSSCSPLPPVAHPFVWMVNRLSGYILFALLTAAVALGGLYSNFVVQRAWTATRFIVFGLGPASILGGVLARARFVILA